VGDGDFGGVAFGKLGEFWVGDFALFQFFGDDPGCFLFGGLAQLSGMQTMLGGGVGTREEPSLEVRGKRI
jgi:hypothetical protein